MGYDLGMAPQLEPDPFDKVVENVLQDPQLLAELDEQHAQFERGELKLHGDEEVRTRLRARGVSLLDDPRTA